jgi:hypothetical protein
VYKKQRGQTNNNKLSMTTYRSKPGPELIIPIVVIVGGVGFIMVYNQVWVGLLIIIGVLAFIVHLFLSTYYQIDDAVLKIRCGFLFNKTVSIETIRKISETNSSLSSPATSLDRLEIIYNKFDTIMVSPKDKKGFIKHLTNLNPDIEVHLEAKR